MSEEESGGLMTPEDAEPVVKRGAAPKGLELAVQAVRGEGIADIRGVRVVPGHHAHPAAPACEAVGQLRDAVAAACAGHRIANDEYSTGTDSFGRTEEH